MVQAGLRILVTLGAIAAMAACGGGSSGDRAAESAAPAAGGSDAAVATAGQFSRASFVLCDALEPHRQELSSIVGFEQDASRALPVTRSECVVRGKGGAFARVELLPAIVSSVAAHTSSFEGEASPAPALGPDAMFVDGGIQPHVIFAIGHLFIDVNAENVVTPSREAMIKLALRVREIDERQLLTLVRRSLREEHRR